jgi:hypothetical protein
MTNERFLAGVDLKLSQSVDEEDLSGRGGVVKLFWPKDLALTFITHADILNAREAW